MDHFSHLSYAKCVFDIRFFYSDGMDYTELTNLLMKYHAGYCVLNSGLLGRARQGTSLVITCSKSYFKMSMVDPCPPPGVLICICA